MQLWKRWYKHFSDWLDHCVEAMGCQVYIWKKEFDDSFQLFHKLKSLCAQYEKNADESQMKGLNWGELWGHTRWINDEAKSPLSSPKSRWFWQWNV